MNNKAEIKGERIAFTIEQKVFEQFNKILYMKRQKAKDILIPLVKSFVEENTNEIKRYDKIFGTDSNTEEEVEIEDNSPVKSESALTQEQRDAAVSIICKFITENDSHFCTKGDSAAVEPVAPLYGVKTDKYIAVERKPLEPLLQAAGLNVKVVFDTLLVKVGEYQNKKSYRMAKVTVEEFEDYNQHRAD